MNLLQYRGFLAPYRTLIGALSIAGQTPTQISELLYVVGARPPSEANAFQTLQSTVAQLVRPLRFKTLAAECIARAERHEAEAARERRQAAEFLKDTE